MSLTNGRDTAASTPPGPTTVHAVARGVLLLLGGVLVILVVKPVGPQPLYWAAVAFPEVIAGVYFRE